MQNTRNMCKKDNPAVKTAFRRRKNYPANNRERRQKQIRHENTKFAANIEIAQEIRK